MVVHRQGVTRSRDGRPTLVRDEAPNDLPLGRGPGLEADQPAAGAGALEVSIEAGLMRLVGEVDVTNLGVLASVLVAARPWCGDLLIDLTGLSFIDVAGTSLLVCLARQLAPVTRVTVLRPPPHLEMILRAVGWEHELAIAPGEVEP